ncbi:MAG: site-specific DNA-methyltransferase [Dehalococcoidia bacterium]|nr:site-specific DNA-methyltransferase [Dehalococcoidia bacterium]
MAQRRNQVPQQQPIPVEATRHTADTRVNIPTKELEEFALREETAPYMLRYPRDPSLDPQLVWKGKDEQDSKDLEVPSVPIYIQEHIAPRAIIEDLRKEQQEGQPRQASFFADFNGMELEKRVEFYQHAQKWTNRMVLGDSLLVMASLAEKEGLKGKVQMVYLDPPYGIKFGSNWQVSTRKRDVRDGRAEDATREPEQVKAFRDTWKLGVHSYLAYWRDRLVVARDLLTEAGSIFVQIGDENAHLVRSLMDEVFGSENFCATIIFRKTSAQTSETLPLVSDYILWYAKNKVSVKYRQLHEQKILENDVNYSWIEYADGRRQRLPAERLKEAVEKGLGKALRLDQVTSQTGTESSRFSYEFAGKKFVPAGGRGWSTSKDGLDSLAKAGRLIAPASILCYIRYFNDYPVSPLTTVWNDTGSGGFAEDKIYVVQTTPKAIEHCVLMSTDPGDLVLDPTCGSGTTAYVAEQWGRRWITVDTSRVAVALARTRLMSARFPYYVLADTPEGIKKEAEVIGQPTPSPLPPTEGDIKKGFVYKRVPHVTLKSIANNPDIKEGMTRAEIDAAIARHAESETLYDKPYEDNKVVRVTGPFTVESLSPHRVIANDVERTQSEAEAANGAGPGQFETMILDNLRKAGVQNTVKDERLKFETLEPFAGVYIHGDGTYVENGQARRVAICIGPEHGTVGKELVQDAAKEAVRGVGFDLLIVCGFAFDPYVSEEVKRYGKLRVLQTKINPDLQMGDEFLKKTGAGNLFMVFGEPDIAVTKQKDGKLVAQIKGLDVYDPTTGQIRSNSTNDIACWFIDTDYNEECFFVRHAYFCGGDEPYERLQRALKADVDESAWASLYSTVSRPFDPPKTGKIAVKVINHYGDEVMKVYDLASPK